MFTKKALLTGILACSSAAVLAQGPLGGVGAGGGGFAPPSGLDGGEASNPLPVLRTWHRATVDLRPLADAYTPYACVCAEAQIDNLVRITAQAKATPTSLPGLAEQTANFLQNQGQPDEGGGDDAQAPVAFEGAGLPAAPGEGGEPSDPSADDSPEGNTYAISLPADLENQSPLPQPFLISSIVNADIQITDLSSGGGEQPEDPDEGDSPEDEFEEGEEEFEEEIES